jgi:hypothetical protein
MEDKNLHCQLCGKWSKESTLKKYEDGMLCCPQCDAIYRDVDGTILNNRTWKTAQDWEMED